MTETIFVGVLSDDENFMAHEAARIQNERPGTVVEVDGPDTGFTFYPRGFKEDEEADNANSN